MQGKGEKIFVFQDPYGKAQEHWTLSIRADDFQLSIAGQRENGDKWNTVLSGKASSAARMSGTGGVFAPNGVRVRDCSMEMTRRV